MKLPTPSAPFSPVFVAGESITIDTSGKVLVLPTENQNILSSFNEYVNSTSRCNLTETPCGGLKNSIMQDYFPGSLSIEGDGCYLQNVAGTYTGKTIGAGKLSETSNIINSGNEGIIFCTADGVEYRTADNEQYLVGKASAIIEQFKVVNISNETETYTITIRCPDEISSIELFNISSGISESISVSNVSQSDGSQNTYTFSRTLQYNSSESLQLTIIYSSLAHTQCFSNSGNQITGLQNLSESFIAWYDTTSNVIDFIHFTHVPKSVSVKHEADGNISQITIEQGNGQLYHGQITHTALTAGSGLIPNCLNAEIEGSITKFLKSHGMLTGFIQQPEITTWVVPAISDTKILPLSEISDDYLEDTISIRASPGEYTCASFVLQLDNDCILEIESSDLVSGETTISKNDIDIKVVKCWYQDGNNTTGLGIRGNKYLTPELLLHDDLLVLSNDDFEYDYKYNNNGNNSLRLDTGSYIDISSEIQNANGITITPLDERTFCDSESLNSVHLQKGRKKQIWINLHVPVGAIDGTYDGTIMIKKEENLVTQINLCVSVLPIQLLQPSITYSIYYRGYIADIGSISSESKTVEQFTAEHIDMFEHGVTSPTLYGQGSYSKMEQALAIREECGIDNTSLYYIGLTINSSFSTISDTISFVSQHGVQQLYVYGIDERNMDTEEYRSRISSIKSMGAKIFCAEYDPEYILNIADVLDIGVAGATINTDYSTAYHSNNNKIFLYNCPQTIPEYPRVFRLNYGLSLWQNDYDGAMDYAYQHSYADMWNDFDHTTFRDHVFAYPTANGVIDTVQWEGFREAVNDIRYLATLQATITAHPGTTATAAQGWLDTLKTTDLTNSDLDTIRGQMINYILALQVE